MLMNISTNKITSENNIISYVYCFTLLYIYVHICVLVCMYLCTCSCMYLCIQNVILPDDYKNIKSLVAICGFDAYLTLHIYIWSVT